MRIIMRWLCATACLAFTSGCGGTTSSSSTPSTETIKMDGPPPASVDEHDHPNEGPHHGDLIELGNEEYHAELVHDEESVTVYVLDAAAAGPVEIEASEVTINLIDNGTPAQFKLPAHPEMGDSVGKTSRFSLSDAKLAGHLNDQNASAKLMITINGTPYRGEVKHDHSDSDHNHAH